MGGERLGRRLNIGDRVLAGSLSTVDREDRPIAIAEHDTRLPEQRPDLPSVDVAIVVLIESLKECRWDTEIDRRVGFADGMSPFETASGDAEVLGSSRFAADAGGSDQELACIELAVLVEIRANEVSLESFGELCGDKNPVLIGVVLHQKCVDGLNARRGRSGLCRRCWRGRWVLHPKNARDE
jgi:hypothetical protein